MPLPSSTPAAPARRQRGAATLLFLLIASLALMAATASALMVVQNAQRLQYSEHTATQAQANAWAGIDVLSSALATLATGLVNQGQSPNPGLAAMLTQGGNVSVPAGASFRATYRGTDANGYLLFDVGGMSAGASHTLRVAFNTGTSSMHLTYPGAVTFTGTTNIGGALSYLGSTSITVNVINGSLNLTGASTTGISGVCASSIQVSGTKGVGTQTLSSTCAASLPITPASYKPLATVVFSSSGGSPTYTAQFVKGIAAGTGGSVNASLPSWLCPSSNPGCVSYSKGSWTVTGPIASPGVLWFDAALSVSPQTTVSATLIAAGALSVGNHATVYGFNFLRYYATDAAGKAINPCDPASFPNYATNLCGTDASGKPAPLIETAAPTSASAVGNIGLLSGGDITLTGGPSIYGSVFAAGILQDTGGGGSADSITGSIYTAGYDNSTNLAKGGLTIVQPAAASLGGVPIPSTSIPRNNVAWVAPL